MSFTLNSSEISEILSELDAEYKGKEMKINYKKQGKRNKQRGGAFELSVRKDLEERGFIVTKWMNNVDLKTSTLIPAKRKFNPFNKVMTIGTGFPDYITFKIPKFRKDRGKVEQFTFVEAKSNGYLDKTEKSKAGWYINKFGLPFIIAKKSKKRGEIEYKHLN